MDAKKRANYCNNNKLCFVSLNPIVKDANTIMFHSVAGPVLVNNEYINPKPKVQE